MKILVLLLILFLVKNVNLFQVKCNVGLSRVLEAVTIDCDDHPVCEIDCSEVLKNRIGVCYGKEPLTFIVPSTTSYKEVCLMKNYGENDSIHFSKIIIMKELGINENVEQTDLYQEYLFQYQMKNMMEYCKNSKNGVTAYQRELNEYERQSRSKERMDRLDRIKKNKHGEILEKLYLFNSNKRCQCKSFESYYASTNDPKLIEYRSKIVEACSAHYPDCIEETSLKRLENKDEDHFYLRKRILQSRSYAWRADYIKNKGIREDSSIIYRKNKQNAFFFEEKLKECERDKNCIPQKIENLKKKIKAIKFREEKELEITKSIQNPSDNQFDTDRKLIKGELSTKSMIFDLNSDFKNVPSCLTLDPNRVKDVPKTCVEDYKLYLGNYIPYHTYTTREECIYKFNYNNCIQRYCFVSAFDLISHINWIKTDVDITNREVCEGKNVPYDSRRFYCTIFNYRIGGAYAEQQVNRHVFVSVPNDDVLEVKVGSGLTIDSKWGGVLKASQKIPDSALDSCYKYNMYEYSCETCFKLRYFYSSDGFHYYHVLSRDDSKTPACSKYMNEGGFTGCYNTFMNDKLFEQADKSTDPIKQGELWKESRVTDYYHKLNLNEKREEIKRCYETNCLKNKSLITSIYQKTCGPKGTNYFDEMRHVVHSNIYAMRSYFLNVRDTETKLKALNKLRESVDLMYSEFSGFDKIYQYFIEQKNKVR